jgi:hypothetical protein
MAWRNVMAERDRKFFNDARYNAYVNLCHSQLLSTTSGRVDPTKGDFVLGVSGWPAMPHECFMADVNGWHYIEEGIDGPQLLSDLDPANYHLQPVPEDHHLTAAQVIAALPPGNIDIGTLEGGSIYRVGSRDSWPAGLDTPPINGHVYVKFSWAGLGYKYMMKS